MTNSASAAPHQPGVYVKGDSVRMASSARSAAALVFDGFVLQDQSPAADADYRDLQAQAKELDIKANQSADALRVAIDAKLAEDPVIDGPDVGNLDDNPLAPETGADSPVTGLSD